MKCNKRLKYNNYVAFSHFHGTAVNNSGEIVYVGKCAVFWGKYNESEYLKTSYHKKLMKQDFYKKITIRNGNTFERIAEILESE